MVGQGDVAPITVAGTFEGSIRGESGRGGNGNGLLMSSHLMVEMGFRRLYERGLCLKYDLETTKMRADES